MDKSFLPFKQNVVIIGGGIGGLVTALSLQKAGIESKVYELEQPGQVSGAGIVLSVNAMKVLAQIGVAENVIRQGRVISEVSIANKNGEILSSNDLVIKNTPHNILSVAIHRKRLHKILADELHEGVIKYSKKCISIDTETNVCSFEDGEQSPFSLLIGCDGINSVVRSQIGLNQPSRDANQICYRGTLSINNTQYRKGKFIETWGEAKRFGFVNIGENEIYWFATFRKDKFGSIAPCEVKALLMKEFSDWWGPIPEIVRLQEGRSILRNDLYDRKPVNTWSAQNVVLLGDAIHATTPNAGQGAAMAIESAAELAECLTKIDHLDDALNTYQIHRVARTRKVTELSRQIGRIGNMQGGFRCALRNTLVRGVPDWVLNKSANDFFNATISIEQ